MFGKNESANEQKGTNNTYFNNPLNLIVAKRVFINQTKTYQFFQMIIRGTGTGKMQSSLDLSYAYRVSPSR